MGACSTHRSLTTETGVDALRMLWEVDRVPERPFEQGSWRGGGIPSHGLCWMEQKGGAGGLWSPDDVMRLGDEARGFVADNFGLRRDLGVSRVDVTTTRAFESPAHGRAFMGGMAALELPRMQATRRGTPPHSVWWTGERTRKIRARVYDKSREQGGEPWEAIRLEDQRSLPSGARYAVEQVADPLMQRQWFRARFEPMRKAVRGVRAASFPVIAQAIADEVKYGYRSHREAERLAGTLILVAGGAAEAVPRSTRYRRLAELREAGFVVVDDFMESVEVDLGAELDAALEEFGG